MGDKVIIGFFVTVNRDSVSFNTIKILEEGSRGQILIRIKFAYNF